MDPQREVDKLWQVMTENDLMEIFAGMCIDLPKLVQAPMGHIAIMVRKGDLILAEAIVQQIEFPVGINIHVVQNPDGI